MSNGSALSEISFRYNVPDPDEGLPAFTVTSCGHAYLVPNDNRPVQIETGPVPPESNGIITLRFRDDYYPINLYFDGLELWVPQLNSDGELATISPFRYDTIKVFKVFSTDPDKKPGEVRISASSPVPQTEIGIVIVGTSGLTDPEN